MDLINVFFDMSPQLQSPLPFLLHISEAFFSKLQMPPVKRLTGANVFLAKSKFSAFLDFWIAVRPVAGRQCQSVHYTIFIPQRRYLFDYLNNESSFPNT